MSETQFGAVAAGITAALVSAYDSIRRRHPEVPGAVVSMATGRAGTLAHFKPDRWRARDGDGTHHEIFISAESLDEGVLDVFASLLHESAHALNLERFTRARAAGEPAKDDCSASGYHNVVFRRTAEELGLTPKQVSAVFQKKHGFSEMALTPETATVYASEIAALDAAIRATPAQRARRRDLETGLLGVVPAAGLAGAADEGKAKAKPKKPKPEFEDRNYLRAVCGCTPEVPIRVAARTLARKQIMCSACKQVFALSAPAASRADSKDSE